jgi:hypothetical protein
VKIIRKHLSPLAAFAFPTRYVEETDTVQASFDGGTTWIDFPEGDPRKNNHTPPLDTADPRCDAAARITAGTQEAVSYIIEQLDFGATAVPVVQGLIRLLTPLFTLIPYLSLFYTVVSGILAIGSFALHTAFDEFDWDEFTCLILKNLQTSGRLTAGGFEALLADIAAEYDATQEFVLFQLYANVGFAGLNDQAGIRGETGDCSACPDNWCYVWDLTEISGEWEATLPNSFYSGAAGTYGAGVGWRGVLCTASNGGNDNTLVVQHAVGATVTHVDALYNRVLGQYSPANEAFRISYNGSFFVVGTTLASGASPGAQGEDLTISWDGSQAMDAVTIFLRSSFRTGAVPSPLGSVALKRVSMRGTGVNPFGEDNC